jgi:hypothetical protein
MGAMWISNSIAGVTALAAIVLLALLYNESGERPRLLAVIALTLAAFLCLEILALSHL